MGTNCARWHQSRTIHVWYIYLHLPYFTMKKKPTVNIPYMDPQGVEPTTKNMQLTDDHLAPGRKPQVGFLYWSLWGWSWRTETWSPETRGDPESPVLKTPGVLKESQSWVCLMEKGRRNGDEKLERFYKVCRGVLYMLFMLEKIRV